MDGLAELRRNRGFSQRTLAEAAGISPTTIHLLERGARAPHPGTAKKLADAMGVEVSDVLEAVEAPKADAPAASPALGEEERRNPEDAWREQYLARAGELLDKWERELEGKLALLEEGDAAAFSAWLRELRDIGHPLMEGVLAGFEATSPYKLEALANANPYLGAWWNLWRRVEERLDKAAKLSAEEEGSIRRMIEEETSLVR